MGFLLFILMLNMCKHKTSFGLLFIKSFNTQYIKYKLCCDRIKALRMIVPDTQNIKMIKTEERNRHIITNLLKNLVALHIARILCPHIVQIETYEAKIKFLGKFLILGAPP